jgi:glycosyltransferase involved in cell wall biosynthesis
MAKRTPSISVVVPAHNVGEYLSETIESALSQRIENTEIIVVNDGSTDNTADVMRSFGAQCRSKKCEW